MMGFACNFIDKRERERSVFHHDDDDDDDDDPVSRLYVPF
jgi:hypothetical protein